MRRLVIHYERRDDIYDAFHQLGCALTCFNFLKKTFCRRLRETGEGQG
jgi:hypothetical protein